MELVDYTQHIGIIGIFAILVIKEILAWAGRHKGRDEQCMFQDTHMDQLTELYKEGLKQQSKFDRLIETMERFSKAIEKQSEAIYDLARRRDESYYGPYTTASKYKGNT